MLPHAKDSTSAKEGTTPAKDGTPHPREQTNTYENIIFPQLRHSTADQTAIEYITTPIQAISYLRKQQKLRPW